MSTIIKGLGVDERVLSLPAPYASLLPPSGVIVADGVSAAQFILGGVTGGFLKDLQFLPVTRGFSAASWGPSLNLDETLAAAAPSVSLVAQTTRFDLATAGQNVNGTLGPGLFAGQRKRLVAATSSGAFVATITPTPFAESGKTSIKLMHALDWAELESQASGWRVVAVAGVSASVV
jgi:hypothetical protein